MPISANDCNMARAATTSDVFNAIAEPQRRALGRGHLEPVGSSGVPALGLPHRHALRWDPKESPSRARGDTLIAQSHEPAPPPPVGRRAADAGGATGISQTGAVVEARPEHVFDTDRDRQVVPTVPSRQVVLLVPDEDPSGEVPQGGLGLRHADALVAQCQERPPQPPEPGLLPDPEPAGGRFDGSSQSRV